MRREPGCTASPTARCWRATALRVGSEHWPCGSSTTQGTRAHGGDDADANRLDLLAAWKRLDPVHAEALALAAWDGLTSAQAGRVLDISAVAFRIRLSRARRALRLHLAMPPPAIPSERAPTISHVQEGRIR